MKLIIKLKKSDVVERIDATEKKKEMVASWLKFLEEKQKHNPDSDCTLEIEI